VVKTVAGGGCIRQYNDTQSLLLVQLDKSIIVSFLACASNRLAWFGDKQHDTQRLYAFMPALITYYRADT